MSFQIFHLSSEGNKKAIEVSETNPVKVVQINKDVSSILFLHACAKEALNDKAYGSIYNFDDTAEPLGYYEIVYEDGLVENARFRYIGGICSDMEISMFVTGSMYIIFSFSFFFGYFLMLFPFQTK